MSRKIVFEPKDYYHIYNRGTEKRKIFMDKGDLYYFFDSIIISNQVNGDNYRSNNSKNIRQGKKEKAKNSEKLVSIIAYCLLPNHFHLILKEEVEGGISKFMQKLGTSYTMYFNSKYKRNGGLFQGKFRATYLDKDQSLSFTSVYVNLNYKHHKIDARKSLLKTSLFEYLEEERGESICSKKEVENIISQIGGLESYKKYLIIQSKYFTEKHNKKAYDLSFEELEK